MTGSGDTTCGDPLVGALPVVPPPPGTHKWEAAESGQTSPGYADGPPAPEGSRATSSSSCLHGAGWRRSAGQALGSLEGCCCAGGGLPCGCLWSPSPPSTPWLSSPRPYSLLQACLEGWADHLRYGYPNALAEQYIFQSHHRYFHNCTLEHQVYFDPPEDVLLAMIIAPICLIPFLVTLVIWRSKDGKAQP